MHTAYHGIRYHRETDQCLTHPKYGVIGQIGGSILQFVCDYGLVRFLERSKYNLVLAHLVFYSMADIDWNSIVRDSLWNLPYFFYESETEAVHPHSEGRMLESLYSNRMLVGRRSKRL